MGRAMDFMPLGQRSADSTRFWIFHGYSALEVIKLGWGVTLSAWLLLLRRKAQPSPGAGLTEPEPSKIP